MPLDTFTITGFGERSSRGRKALVTRTIPSTFVSTTTRRSSGVTSGTAFRGPTMPALFTSTSIPPSAPTRAAAAATLASSVTSRRTKRAPSPPAAAWPRAGSRAAIHTSWPSARRRRAVSRPSPLFAPVMSVFVMRLMLRPTHRAYKRTGLPRTRRATQARAGVRHHREMPTVQDELASCIRSWRDRVTPADAGLPAGSTRRVPGLRREEVAQLAGVSLDYLARLEQGRATHPSASVLASLARALRLTDGERTHLFRLAGHAEPSTGTINTHIGPGVHRLLDRLADVPVLVVDASWQVIAANDLANALIGDRSSRTGREANLAWRHFARMPSRLVRTEAETADADGEIVADLHDALGRYPADERLATLIDDLRRESPRFAELWGARPVARRVASRKTFAHPEVGPITL